MRESSFRTLKEYSLALPPLRIEEEGSGELRIPSCGNSAVAEVTCYNCYCSDSPHCYNEGSGLICVYHSIVCLQYEFCITCQLTMHTDCMIIAPGEIFPIKGTFNRICLWRR